PRRGKLKAPIPPRGGLGEVTRAREAESEPGPTRHGGPETTAAVRLVDRRVLYPACDPAHALDRVAVVALSVVDAPEPDARPDLKVLPAERRGDRERAQSALAGRGVVALGPQQIRHAGVDLAEAPLVAQVEADALRIAKARHG